jgi:hypothetical protein
MLDPRRPTRPALLTVRTQQPDNAADRLGMQTQHEAWGGISVIWAEGRRET